MGGEAGAIGLFKGEDAAEAEAEAEAELELEPDVGMAALPSEIEGG